MDISSVLGVLVVLVSVVSAFSVIHQIWITYQRKSVAGLSPVAWTMGTTNALVGLIYSLLIGNLPFTLVNIAWLSVNGTMLALLLYYRSVAKTNQGVG